MKSFIILSLLGAAALALPHPQDSTDSSDDDGSNRKAYDKFEFRVGYIENNGDKAYAAWVAGQSACSQRNRIGEGTTSWCQDGGRWTTVPYPQAEGGKIDIKFECDEDDKQYQDVTYKLKSGKEGSCTKSDETFPNCPEVRTILNCVPDA
ncbi:hypothetical protein GTA08_BOTSDO07419 [Botryosphaeria dothidea]|uniref:Uncharacterized protein n=1 Tax=Botryosphaeria dothidea TaxID=55169 RepID=A0A8H4IN15_9PEZI|nr:hypothetical protein GTA08_BOTSDO07419 [Botryosphaeria dothidea]